MLSGIAKLRINMIVDLFSGIRGWELLVPIRTLGIENNPDAVQTANYNGYESWLLDVTAVAFTSFSGLEGLIASPPCTTFSPAGKGKGRNQIHLIMTVLRDMVEGRYYDLRKLDPVTRLVIEPMRWALYFNPLWIALEQVPSVLPVWEEYGKVLRNEGYSVATGILGAEQFGLGTTRKRAFLVASREKSVTLPASTHSSFYPHRPDVLDPGLPKWGSMADVLGWGMTHRPAGTVTAGGTSTGGAEPFGNGTRKTMLVEYQNGRWLGEWNPRPGVKDLLKLQGFPEDFKLYGNKTSQKRQVGNAVCPPIGKLVLEQVL